MKPAAFAYHRPARLDEALDLLGSLPDAKVLAGGQSLVPLLAMRLAGPRHLVDIGQIDGLDRIDVLTDGLRIGATVTQRQAELDPLVQLHAPLLAEALRLVAHPQIRNRGTICGSIAHGDPAAELPAVAMALDATMILASRGAERRVAAGEFYRSFLETQVRDDEMVVALEIPRRAPHSASAFVEISRRHGDFAVVGVGVHLVVAEDASLADVRIALSGVASTPIRADRAEAHLRGQSPHAEGFTVAAELASASLDPPDDVHASGAYRRRMVAVLVRRALEQATARAQRSEAS